MKTPRDLSGSRLADGLVKHLGYRRVHQEGSHIILEADEPSHQRIAIPAHHLVRIGTLNSILRAVSRHKGLGKQDILDKI